MRLRGLDHITLRVADLDRSVAFYQETLGCQIEVSNNGAGLVQLRAGDSLIDLAAVNGRVGRLGGAAAGHEGRNLDHFCVRVENFDEARLIDELEAHGVSVEASATHNGAEGIGRSLYIRDPDNNQIELKGPALID